MDASVGLVLHHIGIAVEDPQSLGALMERAFECRVLQEDDGRGHTEVGLGSSLVRIHGRRSDLRDWAGAGGASLRYVALCAPDLSGVRESVSRAGLSVHERPGGELQLSKDEWAGVALRLVETAAPELPPGGDRGVVQGIDHVGVASADNARVRERFCGLLGMPVESEQTDTETTIRVEQFTSDKYGVRVVSSAAEEPSGLRVLFLSIGATDLEFLQDLGGERQSGARETPGGQRSTSTSGDKTAIARYVRRRGAGLHHLAMRVTDIDAALERAASQGVELINAEGRPGSRRAHIAFMHPASTGDILFHFVERPA
jgi:catechol 2,3-dioxygenase-like lactoylglutathione lyase family enzyme